MATWIFKRKPQIKILGCYTDEELMRFVDLGTVSGAEMVKLDQRDAEWIPVYSLPWYRETVGAKPEDDLAKIAEKRRRRGPLKILGAIFGVYFVLGIMGATMAMGTAQGSASYPMIGATLGGLTALGAAAYALSRKRKKARPKTVEIRENDELSGALFALATDLAGAAPHLRAMVDVEAIRGVIADLQKQEGLLASLDGGSEVRAKLQQELEAARARVAAASDKDGSLRDALDDEVRALEGRLRNIENTEVAMIENRARRRGLLHELHALRLALGRARIDATQEDATIERLRELGRQLEEERRISDVLDDSVRRGERGARAIGP